MVQADRSAIRTLVTDTITMLLQNSIPFHSDLQIEGLLGVTVDKTDVFIIHIDQRFEGQTLVMKEKVLPQGGVRRQVFPSLSSAGAPPKKIAKLSSFK